MSDKFGSSLQERIDRDVPGEREERVMVMFTEPMSKSMAGNLPGFTPQELVGVQEPVTKSDPLDLGPPMSNQIIGMLWLPNALALAECKEVTSVHLYGQI